MSLYGLLTARCKQAPDSIAIAAPGRRPLRYAALRSRLDSLVSQLHSIGVGPGDPVAVAVDDGPEAAVAFLGAACAGTCAPLDPRFTPREVELCVRTLGARAVIVPAGRDSPLADVARASGIALLELSADPEEEAGTFRLNLTQAGRHVGVRTRVPAADDVALAINTSGTTGRSKLVPLTHANVSAAAQRVRDALDLTSDDRYLNVTPLFYSQGIMLTISSILAGGTVICTSGFDAARFFEWLEECRPTWYSAAPAVHQAIVAEARSDHRRGGYRFRLIRTAAGPLPARLRKELEDTFQSPLVEAYGMTECYPVSSNPLPPGRRKPGSAGLPVATEVAIVDEAGRFMPAGGVGEIVVRGPQVTPGYLSEPTGDGRSAGSRSRFLEGGWFRTGDQGYLDGDGYLFITGRIKEIVNRGGEKISLREIDDVLLAHPDVVDAVAFPLPHLTLGEEIAAAVVRRDTASLSERGILDYAGGRLASFKIPRHIIFLNSLPKSATGKVQRHALAERFGYPSPDAVAARDTTEVTAATSDVQRKLVTIWAQLLGVGMIGITDNFFSLGGNSLLSIQLLAHIERAFGKQLPLPAVLRAPTIEQLAEVIDHDTWPRTWPSLLPIQPHGSKPPFFWVHGEASNRFLASYVGSDQPLYGFEHQSQEGQPARYTSVRDIGEYYLDQLLSVQSTGVYFLGGFSFGGTIAYEMAQQLIRQGRKVGLLVLLDSHFPTRGRIDEGRKQASPSRKGVGHHAQTLSQLAASERLAYVLSRLRDRVSHQLERASKPLRALQCQLAVRTGRRIPASARNHYLLRMYQKALQAYEPAVYPGRAIYIKSEGRSGAHRASWARLVAGGFESHEMPGNHLDLIKQPYAHAWAERLKDWLDQAQQSSR